MKSHYCWFFCFLFALFAWPMLLTAQIGGQPDPDFGQAGEVVIQNPGNTYYGGATVLLPDGKIMVAGNEYDQNGENGTPVFTRLLPDGSPDQSYGTGGQVRPDLGTTAAEIGKMARTTDGKLLVIGAFSDSFFATAFVMRLDAEGKLDTIFGQNGLVALSIESSETSLSAILIKPDGSILLGGSMYKLGSASVYDLLLLQLLPDGTPDPDFGTAGIATADFAAGLEEVLSLALQADGKIVATGGNATDSYNMEIARFHPDGSLDESFANDGVFIFGLGTRDDVAYAAAIQADQKIVFCGTSFQNGSTTGEITLYRLQADGNFDPTFGIDGRVFTNLGFAEFARALILQPDGKILVGADGTASSTNFDESRFWVLRYNTDGSLDPTFGDDGIVWTPTYEQFTETTDLLLQPDGRIIHAGTAGNNLVLWRYVNDIMVGTGETQLADFQLQCSPNPLAEHANVSWVQKKSGELRCDLYDAQGRFLQTVMPAAFSLAGMHRQALRFGSNIPSGACFLVFQVDKQRQVLRLTKM